jgi:excisionase family DNA binding protein
MTVTTVDALAFNPDRAAEMIGLGRTKTYEVIRTGELRSIKVGRRRLVPLSAITEFLSQSSAPGAA